MSQQSQPAGRQRSGRLAPAVILRPAKRAEGSQDALRFLKPGFSEDPVT
jgi:hypothetical protein